MKLPALLLFILLTACSSEHAYVYCENNQPIPISNAKPTILVIGDSISIGYTPYLRTSLPNYDIVHNPCNAMNTEWTKSQIDTWLSGRETFEAVIFNNGLWDIAGWSSVYGFQYEQNLHVIANKIKLKTEKPLFMLSTMVPVGADGRFNVDIIDRNEIAVRVMAEENIPVVDLYTISLTLPHPSPADPHYTTAGYQALSAIVLNGLLTTYGVH